jgi:hypothetical protein
MNTPNALQGQGSQHQAATSINHSELGDARGCVLLSAPSTQLPCVHHSAAFACPRSTQAACADPCSTHFHASTSCKSVLMPSRWMMKAGKAAWQHGRLQEGSRRNAAEDQQEISRRRKSFGHGRACTCKPLLPQSYVLTHRLQLHARAAG